MTEQYRQTYNSISPHSSLGLSGFPRCLERSTNPFAVLIFVLRGRLTTPS